MVVRSLSIRALNKFGYPGRGHDIYDALHTVGKYRSCFDSPPRQAAVRMTDGHRWRARPGNRRRAGNVGSGRPMQSGIATAYPFRGCPFRASSDLVDRL